MSGWLGYLASVAFFAGLAGGVHCAAMCGPILAACAGSRTMSKRWTHAVAYNAGRIASYTVAGALAGALGASALALRGGASAPPVLAVFAGVSMLVLALHLAGVAPVTRILEAAGAGVWRALQPYSTRLLPVHNIRRALALGTLWGWLPCGMVYAVLLTAAATADPVEGMLVMAAFGLGTLPNVLGLTLAAQHVAGLLRHKTARYLGAAVVAALGGLGLSFALGGVGHVWDALCRVTLPVRPFAGG